MNMKQMAVMDHFVNIMTTDPVASPGHSTAKQVTLLETAQLKMYPPKVWKGGKTAFAIPVYKDMQTVVQEWTTTLVKSLLHEAWSMPNLKYL